VCAVAVINLQETIALRLGLKHGEVEISFPEPIYPGEYRTIKVPCDSDIPIQLFVQNTMVQADTASISFEVPDPGTIRAWCIGAEGCAALKARAVGSPLHIT
jgi:hypothetical protein